MGGELAKKIFTLNGIFWWGWVRGRIKVLPSVRGGKAGPEVPVSAVGETKTEGTEKMGTARRSEISL